MKQALVNPDSSKTYVVELCDRAGSAQMWLLLMASGQTAAWGNLDSLAHRPSTEGFS